MDKKLDIEDLETLYKQRYGYLVNYAYSMIGSREDAKEIVHDVFMAVWKNRNHIDMGLNVAAYLKKSTRNRSINYLKSRKLNTVDIDNQKFFLTNSEPTEELLHVAELRAYLYECIDDLPPRCQQIFILSREKGLAHKDIAKKLDLSVKTVENQISIALRKLREMLENSHFNVNKKNI